MAIYVSLSQWEGCLGVQLTYQCSPRHSWAMSADGCNTQCHATASVRAAWRMPQAQNWLPRLYSVCRWLQSDLSSVDRSKTPWVVVGMHRGMYVDDPTDTGVGSPSYTLQQQLERLLVEESVDLVLNGHSRMYHHSCPIVQGHCVGYNADGSAQGPVHAMLGIGGAAMPLRASAATPFWVVKEAFEHGVAQLVADQTSLSLQVRFADMRSVRGVERLLVAAACLANRLLRKVHLVVLEVHVTQAASVTLTMSPTGPSAAVEDSRCRSVGWFCSGQVLNGHCISC